MPQSLSLRNIPEQPSLPFFWNPMLTAPLWWDEDNLFSMQRNINRIFNDFLETIPVSFEPPLLPFKETVSEDRKTLKIEINLPELSEKDIDISVANNTLTIKADKRKRKDGAESYYSFSHSMTLPQDADVNSADVGFRNQILTIRIPKRKQGEQKLDIRHGGKKNSSAK